jgi:hypothetical protein
LPFADPAKKAAYNAAYRAKYRDRELARNSAWRSANAEAHRANAKRWSQANPERAKANVAAWRLANSGRRRERYRTDPIFVITCRLRARLTTILKRRGIKKTVATMALIGCSGAELHRHIERQFEPGMSWNNRNAWHIDHIKQCASFDLIDSVQQAACFHFSNLRPLWGAENLARPRPKLAC